MFAEFVAASQSVKVLGEMLRNAADLKNYNEVASALAKVQEALLAAQGAALLSQEKNAELLAELARVKEQLEKTQGWNEKSKQYTLDKTAGGAVVQKFSGQPEHYACPVCFEKREIQILQDRHVMAGTFVCPACKADYPVKPAQRFNMPSRTRTDLDPYER